MELREALEILNKHYTGSAWGGFAVVSSEVKLTDDIFSAWKTVREYLVEERKIEV